MIQTPSLKRKVENACLKTFAMREREGPVQMRRCGSLQIEKEIRERLWSRKKKATRLLMSQMPGRTSLLCRELVFSGYQFLLGDVAGAARLCRPLWFWNVVLQK
jgi:hypothetical protein